MQQQPFAPVQKAEPEAIVPNEIEVRQAKHLEKKGRPRPAHAALAHQELGTQAAVAVHMLEIARQRRVCVMDHVGAQGLFGTCGGDRLVDRSFLEVWQGTRAGCFAAKQAKLAVRVKSALPDPAP